MNRLELENKRLENFHKLDWQQFRPKYNALEVDIGNSIEHEMAKFICVELIRNGVEAKQIPTLRIRGFNFWKFSPIPMAIEWAVKEHGQKFKHEWERPVIITECRFKGGKRRADIFILDTGECVEIETNHKVKKDDSIVVYI